MPLGRALKKLLWVFAIYFVALLLPMGFDHLTEILEIRPYDYRDAWYHAIFKAGFWYQRVVTGGPRKPRVHFVRVITLTKGIEPTEVMGQNLCGERGQRAFMARLVSKVKSADPALIVLDKWYAPDFCPRDDAGTRQLQQVLVDVSRSVPIVVGRKSKTEPDLRKDSLDNLRNLQKRGFSRKDQIAEPTLRFEEGDPSARIIYGSLTANYDVRRIPLRWPIYESPSDIGQPDQPQLISTLAVVAVNQYDPEAAKGLESDPYTGFLSETELKPYSALDLMCNPPSTGRSDWNMCSLEEGNEEHLLTLKHRVVIIGIHDPDQDFHDSPIGEIPGVLAQANYIESLLDDRYLKPLPTEALLLLSLVWFLSIEAVFHGFASRPLSALLRSTCVTAFGGLLFYVVAVVNLGYYLALWPTGIVAVILRTLLAIMLLRREERGETYDVQNVHTHATQG